ncbi:MAG: FtsW/RodA/SpoVE family cell cycle protein [Planctomycetota bacterium]|nr:FtsW/RodA/SpoVE family cell cycle protein [Planctomycetota bacterium]
MVILLVIGCFTLYSASSYRSMIAEGDPTQMWRDQLKGYGLGFLFLLVGLWVSPRKWFEIGAIPMWFGVSILLAATFTPLGIRLNDANRWVGLMNIRFQPSEMAKFCVPLATIALTGIWRFGSARTPQMSNLKGVLLALILVLIPFSLTFKQPDYGTAVFILALGTDPLLRWEGVFGRFLICMVPLGIPCYFIVMSRLDEMKERFLAMHSPELVPQVWAALQAVGSGGATGKGIGLAASKTLYMHSEYSDFIFAVFAEETGFMGVLLLIALYMVILVCGWRLSRRVEDPDLACLAQVLTLAITAQAAFNMMVNLALAPTKGIPLPFFSHGSTGLAVFMGMIGVLLAISRSRVREEMISR